MTSDPKPGSKSPPINSAAPAEPAAGEGRPDSFSHERCPPSEADNGEANGETSAAVIDAEIVWVTPIVAEVVDAVAVGGPRIPPTTRRPPSVPTLHVGSPFASQPTPAKTEPAAEPYTARGAAMSAVALGVLGIATAWFSLLSSVPALLGIAMGLWGIGSHFRRRAWAGIGLSLLALVLALGLAALKPFWT